MVLLMLHYLIEFLHLYLTHNGSLRRSFISLICANWCIKILGLIEVLVYVLNLYQYALSTLNNLYFAIHIKIMYHSLMYSVLMY